MASARGAAHLGRCSLSGGQVPLESLRPQALRPGRLVVNNLAILLWQYLGQYAKTRLAYKADFLVACLTSILATVAGYGFVLVLFNRIPNLKGWSFEDVLFIYGF